MTSKEWKICKLGNIIKLIGGGTPKTSISEYWNGNIPWISVKDFNNDNKKVYVTEKTITKLGLNKSATKLLQKGDIIISARGTVGEIAVVSKPMAFNQSCYGIKAIPNIVQDDFLYYLLKNSIQYLKHNTHGSVFDTITKETFEKIDILLPPLEVQEKIAEVLSSLDNKIELNNRINNNLEQQAVALFNNYFPYKINDLLPENWRIGTFGEIIELHDSKRIPLSGQARDQMQNKIYPYYGAASLMDYVDNYIFDGIYLLLGEDGTVVDNYGMPILQYVWGKFWVNNHAHILTGKNGFNVESLYLLFKQTPIKSIVTGAVQAKISQTNLKALSVVIPPEDLLKEFNNKVSKLFELIRNNKNENERLIQLRDTLLPKLMSGEIDVSNVDISTDKLYEPAYESKLSSEPYNPSRSFASASKNLPQEQSSCTDKLSFSIMIIEYFYIKIVIIIGVVNYKNNTFKWSNNPV